MELSQAKLKSFISLTLKKGRQSENLFISEGLKNVKDLIHHKAECEYIIFNPKDIDSNLLDFIPSNTIVYTSSLVHKMSSLKTPPGIVGIFKIPNKQDKFSFINKPWTLVLDNINDPGNMGTIIRTAHWFNIQNIILFGNCADVYAPKVVQSTMGSLVFPNIYECKSKEEFTEKYLDIEKPIIITSLQGKPLIKTQNIESGYIILGSESHGVQTFWQDLENSYPVLLPYINNESHPESLNVAIAGAIFMNHFCKV